MTANHFLLMIFLGAASTGTAAELAIHASGDRCPHNDFAVPDDGFVRVQLRRVVEPAITQADIDAGLERIPEVQRALYLESVKPRERSERVVLDILLANDYVEPLKTMSTNAVNRCALAVAADGTVLVSGLIQEPLEFGRFKTEPEISFDEARRRLAGDPRVFIVDPADH